MPILNHAWLSVLRLLDSILILGDLCRGSMVFPNTQRLAYYPYIIRIIYSRVPLITEPCQYCSCISLKRSLSGNAHQILVGEGFICQKRRQRRALDGHYRTTERVDNFQEVSKLAPNSPMACCPWTLHAITYGVFLQSRFCINSVLHQKSQLQAS